MTLLKILKISVVFLILLAVAIGLTSINHPIILKWVTGSAKHHGRPIPARVYANGKLNNDVKVFYTDEADNYLLSFTAYDSSGMLKFINIDLDEKTIERPLEVSENDYDFIAGELFQSETGAHFAPFQDDLTGITFDPQLSHTGKQVKFDMPPNNLMIDSIRIVLP